MAPSRTPDVSSFEDVVGITLPIVATTAVAWPALVRPMLQGDSLGYHLPNAAAWVHAHSLWTTTTWYWWFPGGSELFAAGLLAVAGPLALGFAGTAPFLLLGLRIFVWTRAEGTRPWVAGAVAALTLSSFALAEQAASLENDVWLAAFFLESLWLLRRPRFARLDAVAAVATTTLLKTTGWLYAVIALAIGRLPVRIAALAFVPFILWLIRDATLWPNATIPISTVFYSHPFATTILAHGWSGLVTLESALVHDGPATPMLFIGGLATIVLRSQVRLRIAALAALAIFFVHPFGYNNADPQLSVGASLRYATPFLALGALFIGGLGKQAPLVVGPIALAVSVMGLVRVTNIYAADVMTHGTLSVVILVAIVSLLLPWAAGFTVRLLEGSRLGRATAKVYLYSAAARTRLGILTPLALIAYAVVLAGTHPIDYYEDWLAHGTHRSTFFHWVATQKPAAVVGYGLQVGSIVAVSPQTDAIDARRGDPCGEARQRNALLVIANAVPGPPPGRPAHLQLARECGHIVFDDELTLAVEPHR